MNTYSLEFWGTQQTWLLAGLVMVASVALAVLGGWHLRRRRWRAGLWTLAALAGPGGLFAATAIDATLCYRRRQIHQMKLALASAAGAGALAVAAGALVILTGRARSAIYLAAAASQLLLLVAMLYGSALPRFLNARQTASLISLRSLAILALLATLFKPVWQTVAAPTRSRPILAVLIDASASMATDDSTPLSRYRESLTLLANQRRRLEALFDVRWFTFAAQPEAHDRFEALPDNTAAPEAGTDLGAALRAPARLVGEDLVSVLLISDGQHNGPTPCDLAAADLRVPLHVVGVGALTDSTPPRTNIELIATDAPLDTPAGEVITFDLEMTVTGLANSTVDLTLTDVTLDTPQLLDTQSLWIDTDDETPVIRFTCPVDPLPAEALTHTRHYRIEATEMPGEMSLNDNALDLFIVPTHDRLRVLYIEGALRPEFRWLGELLRRDERLEVVTLVRIDAARFWSRGQIDGRAILDLPATAEEFARFNVILLGDLDASYWSDEQLALLEAFVDAGGGLMMIGGQHTMGPGGYGGTPVEAAMPVEFGPPGVGQITEPFEMIVTPVGARHPIFSGLSHYFMPPSPLSALTGCVATGAPKPGAEVLSVHPSVELPHGPAIVLATQPYGQGHSAVFTGDTTWRWLLGPSTEGKDAYDTFWLQTIRYLAGSDRRAEDHPPALAAALDRQQVRSGQSVTIRALAVGQPAPKDGATVSLTGHLVNHDTGAPVMQVELTSDDGRYYETAFTPPPPEAGDDLAVYELSVRMALEGDILAACGPLTCIVARPPAELEALARNEPLLQSLARDTGGQYTDITSLVELVDMMAISHRPAQRTASRIEATSLHSFPLCFILFAAALTAEWAMRRRWQLQ